MGSTRLNYPFRHDLPGGQLRVTLAPVFGNAAVDGIWWPYGRDLTREVPHLVDDYPADRGRIDAVAYCPEDWDGAPSHVFTRYGRVKTGHLARTQAGFVLLRLTRLAAITIIRVQVVHDEDGSGA